VKGDTALLYISCVLCTTVCGIIESVEYGTVREWELSNFNVLAVSFAIALHKVVSEDNRGPGPRNNDRATIQG
jgi:hypothetical protein